MKCNFKDIALSSNKNSTIEGRLNYKKRNNASYRNQSFFKERWFRLVNNCLFYYKLNEVGVFETNEPAGVIVMENSSVQMEHGNKVPFSFSISFLDEPEKRHILAARTEENVIQWVSALRRCSYEYMRGRLYTLQAKIYAMTGQDPLLMVPRNEGASLWRPAEPFSTKAAGCTASPGFNCHLHGNGFYELAKSKSTGAFYVPLIVEPINEGSKSTYKYNERSNTSNIYNCLATFDNSNHIITRTAPSPPVRKKNSPKTIRSNRSDVTDLIERSKNISLQGILDETPIPPKRKMSPRVMPIFEAGEDNPTPNGKHSKESEDNLIDL